MQPAQSIDQLFNVQDSFKSIKLACAGALIGFVYSYIFNTDPRVTALAFAVSVVGSQVLKNLVPNHMNNQAKFWSQFAIEIFTSGLEIHYFRKLNIIATRGVHVMCILNLIQTIYQISEGQRLLANG